jgi:ATP-binding cassette, subfamily C, bacterial
VRRIIQEERGLRTGEEEGGGTLKFLGYFLRAYPLRSTMMVVLLAVGGLAEGIGVLSLLPLIELASPSGAEGAAPSAAAQLVVGAFEAVGVTPSMGRLLIVIVLAMTAKAALLWFAMRQVGYTVARVTTDLRMELLGALLGARWRYFASEATGRFANAMSTEVNRAASAYREGCIVLSGIIQASMYFVAALLVSWELALIALVAGASLIFLLRRFVTASREAGQAKTQLMRSLVQRLTDSVRGMKPIKAMGREDHLRPLLERETEGLNQAMRKGVMAAESLRLFQEPSLVILLGVGLYLALAVAGLPFASIMVMAFIFYRLMTHMNTLQMRYQIMAEGESAFWSFDAQVRRAVAERESAGGNRNPPALTQGIELDSVWFGYEDEPVLQGLSLSVPAGCFVTLYGASGAGKTTIADLILRLHEPDRGRITIDGIPLEELDIAKWRRCVGYVPQEMLLFHDTVFRNVTLGDPAVSRQDVEQALKDAGAWDFVSARPEGLETNLGEQGALFSGGQRQRIAIARALVHRPRLLILDEVTTALDPETEAAICETLAALPDSVTILAISHQSALREAADIVYCLERGEVTTVEHLNPAREVPVQT